MAAMADLVAEEKIRSVGVSNFNAARMRRAHAALSARGLALASNQVRYSLLDRRIESNGTVAAAKELGVTIIAYSPMAQGLLSGRYPEDPGYVGKRPGPRKLMGSFRSKGLERSRPLVEELRKIAAARGATASQVGLAWLCGFHGDTVVVIPGASRPRQAQ
jgi:aryl-alcohol dehydrogenase-like predicted oxidoreductase